MQVGESLGAQYVLTGSVERKGGRVRVRAKLLETRDGREIWSKAYEGEESHVLLLQSEITGEIEGVVAGRLDRPRTADGNVALTLSEYQAYDLYLRGRYFWNKRTADGFSRAAKYFNEAVEKDPNYARAYAGLADCYSLMSGYELEPNKEAMPKARRAAKRALELDPDSAEAHTSMALITQNFDWDWKKAEQEYRRAIELNPNYATAHHWYAEALALQGRFEEAFREIDEARRLDPLSLIILTDRGAFLYFARQYDPAIEQFRSVLEMEPGFGRARMLVLAYEEKQKYAEALAEIEDWRRVESGPWQETFESNVNGRAGNLKIARESFKRLRESAKGGRKISGELAIAALGLGDKEKAIQYLQQSYADRSINTAIKVDPVYDPLRNDARFQAMLKGMGLQ